MKCEHPNAKERKIDAPVRPREILRAGLAGEQAGAGAARARDADWGNCARAAAEARKAIGKREGHFGRLRDKCAVPAKKKLR